MYARFKVFSFSRKSRINLCFVPRDIYRIKFVVNLYQFADFPDTLDGIALIGTIERYRIASGNESTALDYQRVLRDRRIVYPRELCEV